ncbi:13014_t:CDS:2 [Funneliformis mosseae]|uniref:13014_t:CDS:1 n=1 Tax=Funneliformis mosseae TaxID=27381 RepID=A0A9N9FD27_FUNMO|nr:13014_t:CDS:2 [Funneliformis mosseae]
MRLNSCIFIVITCALLANNTNAHKDDLVEPIDKPFVEKYKSKELDFLTFGDWSYAKVEEGQEVGNQTKVANVMMKWGESYHSDFVLSVGGNFDEDHEGVLSVHDEKWNTTWKDVYKGRLAEIPWYIIGGNHDWYGNITAQIDYSLNNDSRFFFPSTFYVRESYFGGSHETKVAWIHIDTDIFYYDPKELNDTERLHMKQNFEKFGWDNMQTIEDKLKWIEDKLIEQRKTKWIFVVGHHPLIGKCLDHYQMKKLRSLFEKYRVAAYFAGHNHVLELETTKFNQPVTYFISGAGSRTDVGCEGKDWGMPEGTLGFLHSVLRDDEMLYEFIDTTTQDFKVVYQGTVLPRLM